MKIPTTAKKVFEGIIFDVYQWEQKQFDGSFKTFERLKRPDTAIVYAQSIDGRILLSKEQQPGGISRISGLGGRVEEGERPLETAKRELLEESGYEADDYKLWLEIDPYEKIDWTVYVYIAKNARQVSDSKFDAGEKIELIWATFDQLINELIYHDEFGDLEVSLELLKANANSEKLSEIKELFSIAKSIK